MLKTELAVGDIVAFQPSQNAGPFRSTVVALTPKYKGVELDVMYSCTLYNPRPRSDEVTRVKTNGKFIVDLWDNYVHKVERERERNTETKQVAKVEHLRSQAIVGELERRGVSYELRLSTFFIPVEGMETLLGLEACSRCARELVALCPEDPEPLAGLRQETEETALACLECDLDLFYK